MLRDMARHLLAQADRNTMRLNSFKNFHAKGLNYICLSRHEELTVKIYCIGPDAEPAFGTLLVHPHNHRYAFSTYVLAGRMWNVNFTRTPNPVEATVHLDEYRYRPFVNNESPTYVGSALIGVANEQEVFTGNHYSLEPHEIHSIRVEPDCLNVLMLVQHRTEQTETSLFMSPGQEPSPEGLYEKFTAEELGRLVERVKEII